MFRPFRAAVAALVLFPAAALTQEADNVEYLRIQHDATGRFGIAVAAGPESGKNLTFSGDGGTNNTAVSVGGFAFVLNAAAPTTPTAEKKEADGRAWTTAWDVPPRKVTVTQEVVLTRGAQSGKLDTAMVRYTLANKAKTKQKVGLRFMLDTLIGGNDGVPFVLPERADLVTTGALVGAKTKNLPDYVQAFERPDFKNPGTVAHLGVRVSAHIATVEPPDSLLFSHWPGSDAPWTYPIQNMGTDSAIGLYWTEAVVEPGAERRVGFTYGLAKVVSGKSGGKLGLTAGGSFKTGGTITVTAYLDRDLKRPTVTLTVPDGLKLATGVRAQQTVTIRPNEPNGRATWRLVCERPGQYTVKAELEDGAAEEMPLIVR